MNRFTTAVAEEESDSSRGKFLSSCRESGTANVLRGRGLEWNKRADNNKRIGLPSASVLSAGSGNVDVGNSVVCCSIKLVIRNERNSAN